MTSTKVAGFHPLMSRDTLGLRRSTYMPECNYVEFALRVGRPRPENFLSDTELRQLAMPVLMIWGDEDPYGGAEIGQRACALMPNARLEVIQAATPPSSTTPSAAER
jgi:pimeloyl-ACP methyl ester carboxylesterase